MTRASMIGAAFAACLATSAAWAGDIVMWTVDEETEGEDVFWTSPTAVNPDAIRYDATYTIALVEVNVSWIGIPFGPIDVTDQIPPEQASGAASAAGPAPVDVFSQTIIYPEPPEPPTFGATINIALDGSGFGQASVTDIVLGTFEVDLGVPFGIQTVQLEAVHLVLDIAIEPITADLDGDGDVDAADLAILLSQWGERGGPADLDGDGVVGASDLAILLANWGS